MTPEDFTRFCAEGWATKNATPQMLARVDAVHEAHKKFDNDTRDSAIGVITVTAMWTAFFFIRACFVGTDDLEFHLKCGAVGSAIAILIAFAHRFAVLWMTMKKINRDFPLPWVKK